MITDAELDALAAADDIIQSHPDAPSTHLEMIILATAINDQAKIIADRHGVSKDDARRWIIAEIASQLSEEG